MSYDWAWVVAGVSALLGTLALARAWRGLRLPWLRLWLSWLIPVLLLLPAPIPGYEGNFAPAFVVFIFEWLFQRSGSPQAAGRILLAGTGLVTAGVLGWYLLRHRRRSSAASE